MRIETKLEKMSEKSQMDLQAGLQQGMKDITAEIGNLISQYLPQVEEVGFGKVSEVL